jgi:CRP-like cAMP-binding protein
MNEGMFTGSGLEQTTAEYEKGNLLLDTLPAEERARILPHLRVFEAEAAICVLPKDRNIQGVLFPIDAIFSTTAELSLGNVYEVAVTGRNGVIGAELALGVSTAPRSVMAQVEGRAAAMSGDVFSRCMNDGQAFARAVYGHIVRRLFVAEQFIACNFAHSVTERCARWVLTVQDELGRAEFGLRAEFLGMMLGMKPQQAVSAAQVLQHMGAIDYADENVRVLDAATLLEAACECYTAQRRFMPVVA